MKKILNILDVFLSYFSLYNLLKYRLKYQNGRIAATARIVDNGGTLRFQGNNVVGDYAVLIKAKDAEISFGENVWVGTGVYLEPLPGKNILLFPNCSIQDRCRLIGEITVGRNVLLAPNVFASSGNHFFNLLPALPIRIQDLMVKQKPELQPLGNQPVVIEDDCWVGTNVIIRQGVRIGKGSIIGANSVVTKSVTPYSIVAGAPAKVIQRRLEFEPPDKVSATNIQDLPYFYDGFNPQLEGEADGQPLVKLYLDDHFSISLGHHDNHADILYITLMNESGLSDVRISYNGVTQTLVPGANYLVWSIQPQNSEYNHKFSYHPDIRKSGPGKGISRIFIVDAGLKRAIKN